MRGETFNSIMKESKSDTKVNKTWVFLITLFFGKENAARYVKNETASYLTWSYSESMWILENLKVPIVFALATIIGTSPIWLGLILYCVVSLYRFITFYYGG